MTDERTYFWQGLVEERNAAIDRLFETNGALQAQLDNALEERDNLLQFAGSLQEIVADRNAEIEALRCQVVERNQELDWYYDEVERLVKG